MPEKASIQWMAVECQAADVTILLIQIAGNYLETFAIRKVQSCFSYERTPNCILIRCGSNWIKAQCGKEIPCRHLTQIVVADEPIWSGFVLRVDDLLKTFLRAPGFTSIVVKIGEMMAWLIAMNVLSNHSCNVFNICILFGIDLCIEHGIELCNQLLVAAQQLNQTG